MNLPEVFPENLPAESSELQSILAGAEHWLRENCPVWLEPDDEVLGEVDGLPICGLGPMLSYEVNTEILQELAPEIKEGLGGHFSLGLLLNDAYYTPLEDGRLSYVAPSLMVDAVGRTVLSYFIGTRGREVSDSSVHGERMEAHELPYPLVGAISIEEVQALLPASRPDVRPIDRSEAILLQSLIDRLDGLKMIQDGLVAEVDAAGDL